MLHTHFTTCGERSEEQFLVNSKQWRENLVDHPVFKAGKYMTHIWHDWQIASSFFFVCFQHILSLSDYSKDQLHSISHENVKF